MRVRLHETEVSSTAASDDCACELRSTSDRSGVPVKACAIVRYADNMYLLFALQDHPPS